MYNKISQASGIYISLHITIFSQFKIKFWILFCMYDKLFNVLRRIELHIIINKIVLVKAENKNALLHIPHAHTCRLSDIYKK